MQNGSYLDPRKAPAKTSVTGGIFGFLMATGKHSDISSEDENGGYSDDFEFISNGRRGIIVFKCRCLKSGKQKVFHLDLYEGSVNQYTDGRRKTFNCANICSVSVYSNGTVSVDIKKSRGHVIKRYAFDDEEEATRFRQYIEFSNETGVFVRGAFDEIDRKSLKKITHAALKIALRMVDLQVVEEEVDYMLRLNNGNGDFYDFQEFFHLFLDGQVSNLRECLQEWLYQARTFKEAQLNSAQGGSTVVGGESKSSKGELQVVVPTNLVQGELVANVEERVRWSINIGKAPGPLPSPGTMVITNYRVILISSRKTSTDENYHCRYDIPPFFGMTSVPLSAIGRVYTAPPRATIYLCVKDYRVVRVTLSGASHRVAVGHGSTSGSGSNLGKVEYLVQALQHMSFYAASSSSGRGVDRPFAYMYTAEFQIDGWKFSNVLEDYKRQGLVGSPEWQVFDNTTCRLSESYPPHVILPAALRDDDIWTASAFRSRQRLPVVTYRHTREGGATGAVMTRSAQPMAGLIFKNCSADAKLLNLYRLRGKVFDANEGEHGPAKFYILDARGAIAATLNRAAGKGTEDVTAYTHTELIFCNVDNIHVMRTSAQALAELLVPGGYSDVQGKESYGGTGHYAKIEESGWLRHTRLLLMAGILAAEKLHLEGASILVHCSDGWDRTAQICTVAQLILDPYYRSLEGFAVLIEKEWCAFGYKFQDRCGHGFDFTFLSEERSPVFLQMLDLTYQLLVQFPTAFEFNENLLVFLADHEHSGLFGNFFGNTYKQRMEEFDVRNQTKSVWSYIIEYRDRFQNPRYAKYTRPIWPSTAMSRMVLWSRFFSRWDPEGHPNFLSGEEWHDDWGAGLETKSKTICGSPEEPSPSPQPLSSLVVVAADGSSARSADSEIEIISKEDCED